MYDDIKCSYPLPGTPPAFVGPGHTFQTKDLDCGMDEYEITADGRLLLTRSAFACILKEIAVSDTDPPGVPLTDFTGTIDFYDSNSAGSDPGIYTRDGEDCESVDYRATFVNGSIVSLLETGRECKPALPASRMGLDASRPNEEQIAVERARMAENLTGRTMWLQWGGTDEGEPVEVVADGKGEWCVRKADGTLEVVNRHSRDRTFFDSREDCARDRRADRAPWDARKREYDEYAAKWHEAREAKSC